MNAYSATSVLLSALVLAAAGAATAANRTHQSVRLTTPPRPAASDFSTRIDNPWFPLKPGTRYVYSGLKDGIPSRDVMTVTRKQKVIDGVRCVSVDDRLYLHGHLGERTTDWYSQDSRGNVWYFGEQTAELDSQGHVTSTEGTWTTGVNGAKAGIYMPAHPRLGASGLQEYYKGHAADQFKVIGLFGSVTAPRSTNTLLTAETTPLEPGTVDHKMYVRGIGTVLEQTEKGPNERNELISVTTGR